MKCVGQYKKMMSSKLSKKKSTFVFINILIQLLKLNLIIIKNHFTVSVKRN